MKKIRKRFSKKALPLPLLIIVSLIIVSYFFIVFSNSNLEIIDVHEHIMLDEKETPRLVSLMDEMKISKMILLDTPSITFGKNNKFEDYDKNVEQQLKMKALYPDRFLVLYTYPPDDLNGPKKTEEYFKQGISGLKFYNGVILAFSNLTDFDPINSTRMYAAYQKARELHLPVTIHVEALLADQFNQFEQVLTDFPDVTFICPHLCAVESNLAVLESMLNRHQNLYVDSGPWHRVGTFAIEEPEKFREFFIKHSDRIMFGTDVVLASDVNKELDVKAWIQCEKDLLEKKEFTCYKEDGILKGLNLPFDTLKNIYEVTPRKVYKEVGA
jgi:predicted TIM-barrel fold metal-dependent hydrolase